MGWGVWFGLLWRAVDGGRWMGGLELGTGLGRAVAAARGGQVCWGDV